LPALQAVDKPVQHPAPGRSTAARVLKSFLQTKAEDGKNET
jgi:hypothetical protein